MSTRAVHLVIDAADPSRLASFWAAALGWEVAADEPDEAVVWPTGFGYPAASALPLVFVPVPEPKTTKNRVHLDLATTSAEHQAAEVDRLLGLGATRADIGQGPVPWEVMADPEGNEFCVLEPRDVYLDARPVAAIVVDSADPPARARFWAAAAGWAPHDSGQDFASLREPGGTGPYLEFVHVTDAKTVKNRVHVDVAARPQTAATSPQDEARRLRLAGATLADVGQSDVQWIVLADPEGNEFCVLTPR
jgi:predicted enzyme related to lactoylglutathione lyase